MEQGEKIDNEYSQRGSISDNYISIFNTTQKVMNKQNGGIPTHKMSFCDYSHQLTILQLCVLWKSIETPYMTIKI